MAKKSSQPKAVKDALKLKPRTEAIRVPHQTKIPRVPTGKGGAKRYRWSTGTETDMSS